MRTVSIRLDDADYDMLDEMLASMGQTKQTFYETYTKTALRLRKIPFIIEAPIDPFFPLPTGNGCVIPFSRKRTGRSPFPAFPVRSPIPAGSRWWRP